ncbi:MAG: hypothetical protein A2445_03335 [Candidatus Jacksonbacteria bacterium RIFOXYC2_FULL_44_29]|nr:MAG: hypothetical protein UW45_C0032G0003 [Parcubacteria group bacterium GW2011_GWC2_44_22]OGY75969.1 MAG: hypothetical protein A2240_05785 [Candidatus Jacksonbacteria bacterium RIFOXYA2_FULL_43_12]OGY77009.1 MAG: hypothetical protein A2295_05310 [Candidatus Jacksonbacteria bacterium RIFOXYB2_FULL_44_15]OGY78536.1 MAG: hypothetical protein A2550_02555 [Candidatus Jacksonbacteria bacterium RIFOXYD2_FULL_43_21]OGY79795.1 MAG: hypothetical protein A2445_03335 [Candidatus Jacksonbacteria bacteri
MFKTFKIFSPKGFTVFEMLVVIGLMLLVVGAAYGLYVAGFKDQFFIREQNDAIEEARRGMLSIIYEAREATNADNGAYPLELAQNYSFVFYGDIDRDSLTERVRYFLNGTDLNKGVTNPTGFPIVYNPANEVVTRVAAYIVNQLEVQPIFYYYNGNYPGDVITNPLTTPVNLQAVRAVGIKLLVNVDHDHAPENVELDSFVQIRNLKDNL